MNMTVDMYLKMNEEAVHRAMKATAPNYKTVTRPLSEKLPQP